MFSVHLGLFSFHLDFLNAHNGNLFGHVTLKGVFNVLDETRHRLSLPHFQFYFRYARLDHEDQDIVIKLAKYSLLRAPQ